MTCFLVMVPSNGRETFALFHDELPSPWKHYLRDHPGAKKVWEFDHVPSSIDEAVAYARMAQEYGVTNG